MNKPPKPADVVKICKVCQCSKPHGFRWNSKANRYYAHSCRDCSRAYTREYHSANPPSPQQVQEILRLRYEMQRQVKALCSKYLGGKCCRCGFLTEHLSVYEFHHCRGKKNFGITAFINRKVRRTYTSLDELPELKAELDLCQLLCANCHRIEHETRGQPVT